MVLARQPYMGVACRWPNLVSCDRVGLAVWLKRPAESVTATVSRQPLTLKPAGIPAPPLGQREAMFTGFLQKPGLLKILGEKLLGPPGAGYAFLSQPSLKVRLQVDYGHGQLVTTTTETSLEPGWG